MCILFYILTFKFSTKNAQKYVKLNDFFFMMKTCIKMSYDKKTGKEILDCWEESECKKSIQTTVVMPTFEEEILAWCEHYRKKRENQKNLDFYKFYANPKSDSTNSTNKK